jgi:hypothetical protein
MAGDRHGLRTRRHVACNGWHADATPGEDAWGAATDGHRDDLPNSALRYVATDQRLLAIRMVKSDGFHRDRSIVASVPWTDVIGVSARNRWLWTLFTFGFADGTLLTLSRSRYHWTPGGLAYAVNLRALAQLPASELSAPK